MTYCLGIKVRGGLVAIADTRITAGTEVYSNKKVSIHEVGNHSLFIMTAGLRSIRDKSVIYFNRLTEEKGCKFDYMFEAVNAFGEMIRKVAEEDKAMLKSEGYNFNLHSIVGGQMPHDDEHKLFLIFPEGNWIEINEGLKYQIIGNSNYGKPLLNRTLSYETSLEDALKLGFLSFDATQVSASDVDYPIDVIVYQKDSFNVIEHRLTKEDMSDVTKKWNALLKESVDNLPNEWLQNILEKSCEV
ncbi:MULTISPECIES: peptidase [unclassified Arcicella]|uniref:peptidase n=1 Tax=unclassified Arcicella TaxID=2644986 RepID=UPI002863BEC7|nr:MULTISPECIES: peptidase [unclassified Arcicella]MDR6560324.1 putative proteasome-type protease [Arcicella sp. BE51]MDR6810070.1 putative proteasome-type protease [Arcicella sp. BE140]MDR6821419.1 putative proteasome-type protease [Arcicella sp. BE139]